ncbi:MAG: glycosyltransferase family 39 protein, partial [Planctomycetaceae bacterium]|nr:glycosyltransferase family 39 protein [Planctomycetaceae bacterium]
MSYLLWLLPVGLWGILRFLLFEGIQGADDLEHLRFAWELDRIPATHWELRLPYNLLLAGSLRLLGFSEFSAAVPGLIGSFMLMLFCGLTVRHVTQNDRLAVVAMLLMAVLPGDVLDCTTGGSTRILGTGLLAAAVWSVVTRPGMTGVAIAGVLMGLAVDCHLTLLFFVVVFFGVLGVMVPCLRSRIVKAWVLGGTVFLLLDPLPWWIVKGDPLYRLHVIEKTHLQQLQNDTNERRVYSADGSFDTTFITQPVRDVIFSKQYAVLPLMMLLTGFLSYRRMPEVLRGVLVAASVYWLYMAFGTHTPSGYKPFPGTVSYWQPLAIPLALVIGAALPSLHNRRMRHALATVTVGLCLLLMCLGGPWGQNVEVSRQFLSWAKEHPDSIFVADDRTAREIRTLNAFQTPANLRLVPGSLRSERWSVPCLTRADIESAPVFAMINVLNNPESTVAGHFIPDNAASCNWLSEHSEKCVHQTTAEWRPIAYLLPESMRP